MICWITTKQSKHHSNNICVRKTTTTDTAFVKKKEKKIGRSLKKPLNNSKLQIKRTYITDRV